MAGVTEAVGAGAGCALDCRDAPAPGHVPGMGVPNPPQAEPGASRLCSHQSQEQDPSSILCVLPHTIRSPTKEVHFTPKQSRHELIHVQRRCTGDYYLTQNQTKSDKLK